MTTSLHDKKIESLDLGEDDWESDTSRPPFTHRRTLWLSQRGNYRVREYMTEHPKKSEINLEWCVPDKEHPERTYWYVFGNSLTQIEQVYFDHMLKQAFTEIGAWRRLAKRIFGKHIASKLP